MDDFHLVQLDKLERYTCLKESAILIPDGEEESSSDEDDDEGDDEDDDEGDEEDDEPEEEPEQGNTEADIRLTEDGVDDELNGNARLKKNTELTVFTDEVPTNNIQEPTDEEVEDPVRQSMSNQAFH